MSEKLILNSCPFCGSSDIEPDFWASENDHGPGCMRCGATAMTNEWWNTRAKFFDMKLRN